MKLLFLGGLFCERQIAFIQANSSGVIQNAADAFQKNLIRGLEESSSHPVTAINLPFVGSFPKRFAKLFFPGVSCKIARESNILGVGFINVTGVKLLARTFAAATGLWRHGNGGDSVLFVYSAHLPFVISAIGWKLLNRASRLCIIIPDLPEFMGDSNGLYGLLKGLDAAIFRIAVGRFDYAVVLTSPIAHRLRIPRSRYVVVEGIAPETGEYIKRRVATLSFMYSGTLARRYGIQALLRAFTQLKHPDAELWVCGDGDGREDVMEASTIDRRIKYFGQISHSEVRSMQREAFALVNPRQAEGEYTNYSFPSKVMEYMASGRPVIMYSLPGIPEEYRPHYISPKGSAAGDLTQAMQDLIAEDPEVVSELGRRAMEFVRTEKSAKSQGSKILQLVLNNPVM